jgi:hypothetical protein
MPFDETVQTSGWDKSQSRVPDGGPAFENQNVVLQELTPGDFNVVVFGCQDSTACDFNPNANYPSGVCSQPLDPCDDGNPSTVNDVYDANCNCTGTMTGMQEMTSSGVSFFPNPAIDFFQIKVTEPHLWDHVQIIDSKGDIVYQVRWSGQSQMQIATQDWQSGIYLMEMAGLNRSYKMTFIIL